MKRKNNSKEKLIKYLLDRPGIDIPRQNIINDTNISKSRLSELIHSLRDEGYQITTPNRSGIVRLEYTENLKFDFSVKDIRQWLILLSLSKLEKATYYEMIICIISLYDSAYSNTNISIDGNYTDTDIRKYLSEKNPTLSKDLHNFFPLSTFRKDLRELIEFGYIERKKEFYKSKKHMIYHLSEKAPIILFESSEKLYNFIDYFNHLKTSISNSVPLQSIYNKVIKIYDFYPDESNFHLSGKSNKIDRKQLGLLNYFFKHPYKTQQLFLKYRHRSDHTIEKISIETELIFYSVETNCFYILVRDVIKNKILQLRLDGIISIKDKKEPNHHFRCPEILQSYKEMFSASYEEHCTHVKVLFQDFGNVKNRIESLCKTRENAKFYKCEKKIKGIPHDYIYEDDLRGISSFSRYLRSFGSCALVLEPKELQQIMIRSYKNIIRNYEVPQYEK